jgi:hypothetical protein
LQNSRVEVRDAVDEFVEQRAHSEPLVTVPLSAPSAELPLERLAAVAADSGESRDAPGVGFGR